MLANPLIVLVWSAFAKFSVIVSFSSDSGGAPHFAGNACT